MHTLLSMSLCTALQTHARLHIFCLHKQSLLIFFFYSVVCTPGLNLTPSYLQPFPMFTHANSHTYTPPQHLQQKTAELTEKSNDSILHTLLFAPLQLSFTWLHIHNCSALIYRQFSPPKLCACSCEYSRGAQLCFHCQNDYKDAVCCHYFSQFVCAISEISLMFQLVKEAGDAKIRYAYLQKPGQRQKINESM